MVDLEFSEREEGTQYNTKTLGVVKDWDNGGCIQASCGSKAIYIKRLLVLFSFCI